jgi:hypothetical protein
MVKIQAPEETGEHIYVYQILDSESSFGEEVYITINVEEE